MFNKEESSGRQLIESMIVLETETFVVVFDNLLNKFKNSIKLGKNCCLNIDNGDISDAKTSGLIENIRLKTQIIISAVEAVEMIIRIDKMFLNC